MTIPVVSVVGCSGSGKTTLLEKLIRELKRRGYRLAVIKHHYHADFEIDVPGKDSYRFAQAGADEVVIAAPHSVVSIRRCEHQPELAEVAARIQDVDLIITEGYKRASAPKIEVVRTGDLGEGAGEPVLVSRHDELLAIVSDHAFDLETPQFGLEDIAAMADLLEARVIAPA